MNKNILGNKTDDGIFDETKEDELQSLVREYIECTRDIREITARKNEINRSLLEMMETKDLKSIEGATFIVTKVPETETKTISKKLMQDDGIDLTKYEVVGVRASYIKVTDKKIKG